MQRLALALVLVVAALVSLAVPVSALVIRDSIGPDSSMTDFQLGMANIDSSVGSGTAAVFFDLAGLGSYSVDTWGLVVHGNGPVAGGNGPAPSISDSESITFIWHPNRVSLEADPFGKTGAFAGQKWDVTSELTSVSVFGQTLDPFPLTTLLVEGTSSAAPTVSGGFLAIQFRHDNLSFGNILLTGSTEPVGPSAPTDIWCSSGIGSPPCLDTGSRFGVRLDVTMVPEPAAVLLLGSGLLCLGIRRGARC